MLRAASAVAVSSGTRTSGTFRVPIELVGWLFARPRGRQEIIAIQPTEELARAEGNRLCPGCVVKPIEKMILYPA